MGGECPVTPEEVTAKLRSILKTSRPAPTTSAFPLSDVDAAGSGATIGPHAARVPVPVSNQVRLYGATPPRTPPRRNNIDRDRGRDLSPSAMSVTSTNSSIASSSMSGTPSSSSRRRNRALRKGLGLPEQLASASVREM